MKKDKLTNLNSVRQQKKPARTADQVAQAAIRLILDKVPADVVEPQGFASGGDMAKILTDSFDDEEEGNESDK